LRGLSSKNPKKWWGMERSKFKKSEKTMRKDV
jgi:hypothetical protein